MQSAFGVEHGEISKVAGRLALKSGRAGAWRDLKQGLKEGFEYPPNRAMGKLAAIGTAAGGGSYVGTKQAMKNRKR